MKMERTIAYRGGWPRTPLASYLFLLVCLSSRRLTATGDTPKIVLLSVGGDEFPAGTMQNLTTQLADSVLLRNISIHAENIQEKDVFVLQNKARLLVCSGTVLFLSADSCAFELISSLGSFSTPLVRVNQSPDCDIHAHQTSVITVPTVQPLTDVLPYVLRKLTAPKYLVFYDDDMEDSSFREALDVIQSSLTVSHAYSIGSASDIGQILGSTIDPTQSRHNFIILCNENNTAALLQQANLLLSKFLHQTRWLLLLVGGNVTTIEGHVKDIDNIAVLTLTPQHDNEALARSTQAAFEGITDGLLDVIRDGHNLTVETGSCTSSNADLLTSKVQAKLSNTSIFRTCRNYELYTMSWAESVKRLVPNEICKLDNHVIQLPETLFPTEKYGFNNRKFLVGTNFYSPFTMRETKNLSVTYSGFCFDLLSELANTLNFSYVIKEPEDGMWGGDDGNGSWNGLVGQLQRQVVDIVVAPLTVSPGRRTAVDFTVPFHYEYTGILVRKPDANEGKWRVIVEPFRWQVWTCIVVSLPLMGVTSWLITHAAVKVLQNMVFMVEDLFCDLSKSCWYVFGALLTQGGAFVPLTMPGRLAVGLWWAFCIVIVATYGGNLIAFLTVSKDEIPIPDRETLIEQTRYKWGTVASSVFIEMFKNSHDSINQRIYKGFQEYATEDAAIASSSEQDHVDLVKGGGYALFWDRTALVDFMSRDCNLSISTDLFMPAEFSIAVQKGSPYKRIFDVQVNKLREGGILKYWAKKWFPSTKSCGGVPIAQSKPVSILDVQSAFYLVSIGITLAGAVLIAEIIKNKRHRRKTNVQQVNVTPAEKTEVFTIKQLAWKS